MIKSLVIAGLVLGTATSFAAASRTYEVRRVSGPRADNTVMVRINRELPERAPYALTGERAEQPDRVLRYMGPRNTPRIVAEPW